MQPTTKGDFLQWLRDLVHSSSWIVLRLEGGGSSSTSTCERIRMTINFLDLSSVSGTALFSYEILSKDLLFWDA